MNILELTNIKKVNVNVTLSYFFFRSVDFMGFHSGNNLEFFCVIIIYGKDKKPDNSKAKTLAFLNQIIT